MHSYLREYQDKITSGEIIVGNKVKRLYLELLPRYLAKIDEDGEPLLKFDVKKGRDPIDWIEKFCPRPKRIATDNTDKVELMLWQKAWIEAVHGILNAKTGFRHFREVLCVIGRKNGKTALGAFLMLYHLIKSGEDGAEIYSAATKLDQAKIVYKMCNDIIKKSPILNQVLKRKVAEIVFSLKGRADSIIKPLASDAHTLDGLYPTFTIIDEIHAHKERALYDVIMGGMTAALQPLSISITTAGVIRESIYDSLYVKSKNILDGVVEFSKFFPVIYELDNKDEFDKPEMWIKANPALGIIKQRSAMESYLQDSKNDLKIKIDFLTKHCNIPAADVEAFLDFDVIKECEEKTFDIEDFRGAYCFGGIDLSRTTDLTAASIIFIKPYDPTIYIVSHSFMSSEQYEKNLHTDRVPYDVWKAKGWLTLNPGNKVDHKVVSEWFSEMKEKYNLYFWGIGIDPWSADFTKAELSKEGFRGITDITQSFKVLTNPTFDFKGKVLDRDINYNGNALLSWALSNATIKIGDNGSIKPIKGKDILRIDPFIATLNAFVLLRQREIELRRLLEVE